MTSNAIRSDLFVRLVYNCEFIILLLQTRADCPEDFGSSPSHPHSIVARTEQKNQGQGPDHFRPTVQTTLIKNCLILCEKSDSHFFWFIYNRSSVWLRDFVPFQNHNFSFKSEINKNFRSWSSTISYKYWKNDLSRRRKNLGGSRCKRWLLPTGCRWNFWGHSVGQRTSSRIKSNLVKTFNCKKMTNLRPEISHVIHWQAQCLKPYSLISGTWASSIYGKLSHIIFSTFIQFCSKSGRD